MSERKTRKDASKRALTAKQEAFCQLYTVHWNATRAAKEAGYSPDSAMYLGYQLLQNPLVKSRIAELADHALSEIGVTRERVLTELARIAFVNMKDLATWNESGVRIKPSDEIDEITATAIQEVTETVTQHGGTLRIKQHDKAKALELLGRHLKLFADRVEHSGPDGQPIAYSDHEAAAKLAAILNAARARKVDPEVE